MAFAPTARDTRALFSITFLTRSISIIIQTVSPIVLVDLLGSQRTIVGWMIAGFWIANAIGSIAAAGLIRNRYRSTLVGFVILSFAFFAAASIETPFDYAASIGVSGLGLSLIQAFLVPSMHMSATRDRPHAGIAKYSTALSLGGVVGPLAAAAAIAFYGFSIMFLILSVVSVATLLASIRIGLQRSFKNEDTRKGILPSNIIRTIRHRTFANFYLLNFLYSLLLPILLSYGGIYAETKFQINASYILAMFAIIFIISSASRFLLSRYTLNHMRVVRRIGFVALFFSFLLIANGNKLSLLFLGFILFSIAHALVFPITTYMALESAGKEAIISSTYIFATSSGFAEFISPLIALSIILSHSYSTLFLVMSPIALLAMLLAIVIPSISPPGGTNVKNQAQD